MLAPLIVVLLLAIAGPAWAQGFFTRPDCPAGIPPPQRVTNQTFCGQGIDGGLYVWNGVTFVEIAPGSGGSVTGTGTPPNLAIWLSPTSITNYGGTICAPGNAIRTLSSAGVATCVPLSSGGDLTAKYILQQPAGDLPNAQAISALSTAILIGTTGTGVISSYGGSTCPGGQFAVSVSATGVVTCAAAAGGGTVTGTGTPDVLTKWDGSGTGIEDSVASQSASGDIFFVHGVTTGVDIGNNNVIDFVTGARTYVIGDSNHVGDSSQIYDRALVVGFDNSVPDFIQDTNVIGSGNIVGDPDDTTVVGNYNDLGGCTDFVRVFGNNNTMTGCISGASYGDQNVLQNSLYLYGAQDTTMAVHPGFGNVLFSFTPGTSTLTATHSILFDIVGGTTLFGADTFQVSASATPELIITPGVVAIPNQATGGAAECAQLGTNGELTKTGSPCGGAGSSPGGADTDVQFNDAGSFGGKATFTFDKTTDTLTAGDFLTSLAFGLPTTPTANPIATFSGLSIQAASIATADRQFLANIGVASTQGTGDTVGLYVGVDKVSGAADVWSMNSVLTQEAASGSYNAQGYEIDFNNLNAHRGDGDAGAGLAPPVSYGWTVTGAGTFRSTAGIGVFGPGTPIWNRGIVFGNSSISATGSTFQDLNAGHHKSVDIRGNPAWGIYQSNPMTGGTPTDNWLNGGVILGPVPTGSLPAAGNAGRVVYDSTALILKCDNGASWTGCGSALDLTADYAWTGNHSWTLPLVLKPQGTLPGQTNAIRFLELAANGTNFVGFKAPDSITANTIWTLPALDGPAGSCLATSGTKVLGFINCSGTPGPPTGSDQFNAGSGAFGGESTILHAAAFGLSTVATGATNNAALVAALAAMPATGGTLILPAGTFDIGTTPITVSKTVHIDGQGIRATQLRTNSATANMFNITANGVAFRYLSLATSVPRTAGAALNFDPGVGNFIFDPVVDNVQTLSHFVGINLVRTIAAVVQNCSIIYANVANSAGIIVNSPDNPDAGDGQIKGCSFNNETNAVSPNGTSIVLNDSGGWRITNNKMLFGNRGVWYSKANTSSAADLLIFGNSIEQQTTASIEVGTPVGSTTIGPVLIQSNQIGNTVSAGVAISIDKGAARSQIIGNDLDVSGATLVVVVNAAADGVYIEGNTFNAPAGTAIGINDTATNVTIGPNVYSNVSIPFQSTASAVRFVPAVPLQAPVFGTSRSQLQIAINTTPTGGVLQFACANYTLDGTPLVVTKAITLQGCAPGSSSPAGTILTGIGAQVIMVVNTNAAVLIRDLSFQSGAGGTGLNITAPTVNHSSIIERSKFYDGAFGILADAGKVRETTVSGSTFFNQTTAGTHFQGLLSGTDNCDGGGYRFINNYFETATDNTDAMRFTNSSALYITGNATNGHWQNPLHLLVSPVSAPCSGPGSSQVEIIGNQLTSQIAGAGAGSAILLEDRYGTGAYSITNNHLGSQAGDVLKMTSTVAGGIAGITITGNTFQTVVQVGKGAIRLDNVLGTAISGNSLSMGTDISNYATNITNVVYGVVVSGNTLVNPVANAVAYQGSGYILNVWDGRGNVTRLANLGALGNGSHVFCPDCRGSQDAGYAAGACTSAGPATGTAAKRQNGTWQC